MCERGVLFLRLFIVKLSESSLVSLWPKCDGSMLENSQQSHVSWLLSGVFWINVLPSDLGQLEFTVFLQQLFPKYSSKHLLWIQCPTSHFSILCDIFYHILTSNPFNTEIQEHFLLLTVHKRQQWQVIEFNHFANLYPRVHSSHCSSYETTEMWHIQLIGLGIFQNQLVSHSSLVVLTLPGHVYLVNINHFQESVL